MASIKIISASQIKAGRALLNWSQEDLAAATRLSIATIRKMELGHISPRLSTTKVLRETMEHAGVDFLESDGVRRHQENVTLFEGASSVSDFVDYFQKKESLVPENFFIVITAELVSKSVLSGNPWDRFLQLGSSSAVKCLFIDEVPFLLPKAKGEQRLLSKSYIDTYSFCVYKNMYAILTIENLFPKIIVLHSPSAAHGAQKLFLSMWNKAANMPSLHQDFSLALSERKANASFV